MFRKEKPMSNKLAETTAELPGTRREVKTRKIIFITVLALIGILIAAFGFGYKETNPADEENDFLIMGWLFAMPGILIFLDSFFYLANRTYRSNASFVLANFFLMFLGIFVTDMVFFIINRALDKHETVFKIGHSLLAIAGISLLYAVLSLLPASLYRVITWKKD